MLTTSKTSRTRLSAILTTLAAVVLLQGCSSGPSDDVIEKALKQKHSSLQFGIYELDDFDITNSYTREVGGETVHYLDYVMYVEAADEARGTVKDSDETTGTLALVMRGDKWYLK